MRIVFWGSEDLAQECLCAILDARQHSIVACVTQPDRPKGRNLHLAPTTIAEVARKNNIELLQPRDLKDPDFIKTLRLFSPDLFLVIAYGRRLTEEILTMPRIFSINLHASLLPKYRGAAPINWAIIQGETQTGLSIIKMASQIDEGDIIAQMPISISLCDDAISLKKAMKEHAPAFLGDVLRQIEQGVCYPIRQDSLRASLAPKLTKEIGHIDWAKEAISIHNLVRGLRPWPNAYTFFNGKMLKILQTKIIASDYAPGRPGEVLAILKDGFVVRAGCGILLVNQVHLESSRLMDAKSFVAGSKLGVGYCFS